MKRSIVHFVVSEDLDIENHLIGLWTYKNKLHALSPERNEYYRSLLKLSPAARRRFIAKRLAQRYAPPQRKMLQVLAREMNAAWATREKEFIKRIERVHDRPFAFSRIRGILSSADRFGYHLDARWFAVSMYRNTFAGGTDTAMHELMHFMFHTYFEKICRERGVSEKQTWDIKESFTVLLNLEFDDLRFNTDAGYPEHKALREVIKKAWLKHHDFEKALAQAIGFSKKKIKEYRLRPARQAFRSPSI